MGIHVLKHTKDQYIVKICDEATATITLADMASFDFNEDGVLDQPTKAPIAAVDMSADGVITVDRNSERVLSLEGSVGWEPIPYSFKHNEDSNVEITNQDATFYTLVLVFSLNYD